MTAFQAGVPSAKLDLSSLSEHILTYVALLAVSLWIFPQAVSAQGIPAKEKPQLAFEIKRQIIKEVLEPQFARDLPGTKAYILKTYLVSKDSPLADHVETLLMQPNWKTIVAVSHAESNMCKRHLGNNCWGIGGVQNHRYYKSFANGIVDAGALIQKYQDSGLNTPKKMMRRWVGWNNQSWVVANNQILSQLDSLGI